MFFLSTRYYNLILRKILHRGKLFFHAEGRKIVTTKHLLDCNKKKCRITTIKNSYPAWICYLRYGGVFGIESGLKLATLWRARERYYIADVSHTGYKKQ